jgi:hypothetical protein
MNMLQKSQSNAPKEPLPKKSSSQKKPTSISKGKPSGPATPQSASQGALANHESPRCKVCGTSIRQATARTDHTSRLLLGRRLRSSATASKCMCPMCELQSRHGGFIPEDPDEFWEDDYPMWHVSGDSEELGISTSMYMPENSGKAQPSDSTGSGKTTEE